MINYLLNFTLCSALLLLAYQLFLKNKVMYTFNRFYLLGAVILSLTVPLVGIKQSVLRLPAIQKAEQQIQLLPDKIIAENENAKSTNKEPVKVSAESHTLLYIVYGIYGAVGLLLLCRFAVNLNTIRNSVRNNGHVGYQNACLVLVDKEQTPHTFLNFVFLNKADYRQNKIEPDVLSHELTHARQLHSADVLFIELILIFCWFNPFLWLYRKAIQINHEFIADAAVLTGNRSSIIDYQQLLLSKLGNTKSLNITSQFNYSLTKNV